MASPLIWILEDQLSPALPTLTAEPLAPVFMVESARAFSIWPFHKIRLAFLASAMRHFAAELQESNRTVHYFLLREHDYLDSLSAMRKCLAATGCDEIHVVEPSEYHTRVWIDSLRDAFGVPIRRFPNTLFLTDRADFQAWATAQDSPVMETFYRRMRQRHRVLMDGDRPAGGAWNLDRLNRRPFKRSTAAVPDRPTFPPDAVTRDVIDEVGRRFAGHPGALDDFALPVTRPQAEETLAQFLDDRLICFGDYEDAMATDEPVLFHSTLSALLNAGLLAPLDVVRAAEVRYRDGRVSLNCVEGFVRQILGWREYVYGMYWSFMPEFRDRNARGSTRPLPQLFWDGDTAMNCLKQCVGGVVKHAYSHHIQRLMVICNFATLAGLRPQAVNDWFLSMYVDSHDWVVTPNVVGMAMHADGGTVGTKPYVSSAAYINRMSDYCKSCEYDHSARTGDDACPFNFLYWTFLQHFRPQYGENLRMKMVYKNVDRVEPADMREMMRLRKRFLKTLPLVPSPGNPGEG